MKHGTTIKFVKKSFEWRNFKEAENYKLLPGVVYCTAVTEVQVAEGEGGASQGGGGGGDREAHRSDHPAPCKITDKLNMEVDLQSLFGLHVTWCAQLYSLAETRNPPSPHPPALGLKYEGAIGQ